MECVCGKLTGFDFFLVITTWSSSRQADSYATAQILHHSCTVMQQRPWYLPCIVTLPLRFTNGNMRRGIRTYLLTYFTSLIYFINFPTYLFTYSLTLLTYLLTFLLMYLLTYLTYLLTLLTFLLTYLLTHLFTYLITEHTLLTYLLACLMNLTLLTYLLTYLLS